MTTTLVELAEVATSTPMKISGVAADEPVWQVTLDHIESDTGQLLTKNIAPFSSAGSSTHWFDQRYVLYSKLRPYLNKVLLPSEKGIGTTELVPILPDVSRLDRTYLAYFLRSSTFVSWVSSKTTGAKMPRASMKDVWLYKIPLPPLKEQKRIAAILDKADAIRRKRQQAIELADQFLRSVFLDMFGDPVTNPKEWPKIKLGEMCIIVRGGSPRPIQEFLGGTIPWIKIGDATQDTDIYIESTKDKITEAGLTKTRLLKPGSLVFANCGVSLGFARILKIEGCIHDGWLAFDINTETLNQIFLLKALNQITDHFRRIAPDGTQPNLNTEIMKNFELIVPPQNLQVNFEQIVFKANASRRGLGLAYKKADEAFSSLTQSLFEGELRGQKVA